MKKLAKLVLIVLLVICFITPIGADSSAEVPRVNKEVELDDAVKNFYKESYLSSTLNTVSFYSVEDQMTYTLIKLENRIIAVNENGYYMGGIEFNNSTTLQSSMMLAMEPRAGWSGWYNTGSDNFIAEIVEKTTVDVLIGLIVATIPGGYMIAKLALSSIASQIIDMGRGSHRIYNKYFQSGYSSCGILVKNKVESYNNSNFTGSLGSATGDPHWEGNPNDFTQPSACRELIGQYPY